MPMGSDPEKLRPGVQKLHELAAEAGRPTPEVVAMGRLPLAEPERAADQLSALAEIGVTRFVTGARYGADPEPFRRNVDALAGLIRAR